MSEDPATYSARPKDGIGMKISSLAQICMAADNRQSVCRHMMGGLNITPAAIAQNWPGRTIHNAILRGLFIYHPKKETKPHYVRTNPED